MKPDKFDFARIHINRARMRGIKINSNNCKKLRDYFVSKAFETGGLNGGFFATYYDRGMVNIKSGLLKKVLKG